MISYYWFWWGTDPRIDPATQSIHRCNVAEILEVIRQLTHLKFRNPDNLCYILSVLGSKLWASLMQNYFDTICWDIGKVNWPFSWCMNEVILCSFSHKPCLGISCLFGLWDGNDQRNKILLNLLDDSDNNCFVRALLDVLIPIGRNVFWPQLRIKDAYWFHCFYRPFIRKSACYRTWLMNDLINRPSYGHLPTNTLRFTFGLIETRLIETLLWTPDLVTPSCGIVPRSFCRSLIIPKAWISFGIATMWLRRSYIEVNVPIMNIIWLAWLHWDFCYLTMNLNPGRFRWLTIPPLTIIICCGLHLQSNSPATIGDCQYVVPSAGNPLCLISLQLLLTDISLFWVSILRIWATRCSWNIRLGSPILVCSLWRAFHRLPNNDMTYWFIYFLHINDYIWWIDYIYLIIYILNIYNYIDTYFLYFYSISLWIYLCKFAIFRFYFWWLINLFLVIYFKNLS